jgi:hypothetical protein
VFSLYLIITKLSSVLSANSTPKYLAALTSASSSGEEALYDISPSSFFSTMIE